MGGAFDFEFSGMYKWGEVITLLCKDGWCRTQLPREFFELEVPLNIYENDFDQAFKSLALQAKADGYILSKSGRKKPFKVSVKRDSVSMIAFVSCFDSLVKSVPILELSAHKRSDSLRCAGREFASKQFIQDSLNKVVHSSRYRISFYVVSSSFVRSLGVNWTDIWAKGDLVSRPDIITDWALQAVASDDDLAEYRSIEVDIDSSAHIHWGSQVKEQTETFMTGETIQANYTWRDYGLTLTLSRDNFSGIRGDYQLLQRDEFNSILEGNFGGGGKDTVVAYGVFDSREKTITGIPWLKDLPFIGYLFGSEKVDKVKSFFVIEIMKIQTQERTFKTLDSLMLEDKTRYEPIQKDSTDNKLDTLNHQENEVVK